METGGRYIDGGKTRTGIDGYAVHQHAYRGGGGVKKGVMLQELVPFVCVEMKGKGI